MSTFKQSHLLVLICLLLITGFVSQSIGTAYPTLDALQNTTLPARDRIDLARRLLGITDIPAPPSQPPEYAIGSLESFWVTNSEANFVFEVQAELRGIGEHIYVWVESTSSTTNQAAQGFADNFDAQVYTQLRDIWGSEPNPGVDGDPRIYALFAAGLHNSVGAYFSSQNTYPQSVVSTSNQHEMMIFNLDTLGTELDTPRVTAYAVHEFQHMIRHHVDINEFVWLDEGFATFTQAFMGYDNIGTFGRAFMNTPGTQLNTWGDDSATASHYGAAFLFVRYLYERYGIAAVQALSHEPADGLWGVDRILRQMGASGVNEFFADWVLANYLFMPEIGYGYTDLPFTLSSAAPFNTAISYPYTFSKNSRQFATDYYVLSNFDGVSSFTIQLDAPQTTQLVPANAASGQRFWYSNRGDDVDTTLTRCFDLSGVSSATLNFSTWYDIEYLWDYAYVMASRDGQRWDILSAPATTTENPQDTAYGAGFTGQTDGWIEQTVSLDAYAGAEIYLRFEMITDDGVNNNGFTLDDVSIPEIGYFSDFEGDDGGWIGDGWIWIDNILPQPVWVQTVQYTGNDINITRWLAPEDGTGWQLPVDSQSDKIVVAISPIAPTTTVQMPYTLTVTAN